MPVVIPAGASASSSAQSVPGQAVYDYILDDTGKAVAGVKVTAVLNGEFITSISPQVLIQPTQLTTTTDGNGFWQLSLVPNTNLSPANTTYTIQTPFRSYDIQVGPSGPYQSTSLGTLVNVPVTLGPATSSITGALTVSGAFTATAGATINGGLTVTGALSLPGAALSLTGPITLTAAASSIIPGATSMSLRNNANSADNLLVTNVGAVVIRDTLLVNGQNLGLGAAASRIVPGVTSLVLSNHANNADNLSISDAGVAVVRAGLTVTAGGLIVSAGGLTVTSGGLVVTAGGETITAGDLTVTAGRIVMAAAASKLVPGATSFAIRNNADSQNNLLLSNAGAMTLLPSSGGTPPTTSWGTVPIKLDEQSTASGASVTLAVPAGALYRALVIYIHGRSDQAGVQNLFLQFNADVGANYDYQFIQDSNATLTQGTGLAQTQGLVATLTPSGAAAGSITGGVIEILNADSSSLRKSWLFRAGLQSTDAVASFIGITGRGEWRNTAAAITAIKLLPPVGNLITFRAVLVGMP